MLLVDAIASLKQLGVAPLRRVVTLVPAHSVSIVTSSRRAQDPIKHKPHRRRFIDRTRVDLSQLCT